MRWIRFAQGCRRKSVGVFSSRKRQRNLLTGPFAIFSTSLSQAVKSTRKTNILFFGTGDFAIPTLTSLHNRKDLGNIEVVTAARQRGCKRLELNPETPVKDFCLNNKLKVHEIGCKSDLANLARGKLAFDVAVVVSFGFSCPVNFWKLFLLVP